MSEDRPAFVARESDLEVLRRHWSLAQEGKTQLLRLQAPFGGGRHLRRIQKITKIELAACSKRKS